MRKCITHIIIDPKLSLKLISQTVLMMHSRKKDIKELKLMIGISFGVKNSSLMSFIKKDCNPIKESTILEIIMNFVGKII